MVALTHADLILICSVQPAPDLIRLRGTSSGESSNKVVNRLVKDISRQGALRAHRRLFLRVHRFNLDKDKTLGFVTKKKVRQPEWYLHEALLKRHAPLSEFQGVEYPPENEDGYDEPVGLLFARTKHEDTIQSDLDALLMGMVADDNFCDSPPVNDAIDVIIDEANLSPAQDSMPVAALAESTVMLEESTAISVALPRSPPFISSDVGLPAATWARRLGGMSHSSALDKFLDDRKELSKLQQAQFWAVVKEVTTMLGVSASENSKVEAICSGWNRKHFDIAGVNGVGLIGLMSKAHAQKILRKSGRNILATQLGIREQPLMPSMAPWEPEYAASLSSFSFGSACPPQFQTPFGSSQPPPQLSWAPAPRDPPPLAEQPPKKKKAVEMPEEVRYMDVDGLSHRQLGVALKMVSLGQHRDRPVRVRDLKKHFEDQNNDRHVLKFT